MTVSVTVQLKMAAASGPTMSEAEFDKALVHLIYI